MDCWANMSSLQPVMVDYFTGFRWAISYTRYTATEVVWWAFRHPGAVYTNKRFASFAWSSSRIIHGACYYILYEPNQSTFTDRSAGATVQGLSTIYELSAYGCLVNVHRTGGFDFQYQGYSDSWICPKGSPHFRRIEERSTRTRHRSAINP